MGAGQVRLTAEDLERLLWIRGGITIDAVVWDPIYRTATLLVSGAGVTEGAPPPGVEPTVIAVERLMSRIPVELHEPEHERTFTPPGPTVDIDPLMKRDRALAAAGLSHGIEAATPEVQRAAREAVTAAREAVRRSETTEVAVCPVCCGGLLRRSGAALVCVDCGHEQRASGSNGGS